MALIVTTLIEDTIGTDPKLINEHGISFYIEKENHKLLFDTGQTGAFLKNAGHLGKDLSRLEYVFLSHGHYDHSGGLRALTGVSDRFELITGDGFFTEKYGFRDNSYKFLGNNFKEDFIAEKGITSRVIRRDVEEILPGIYTITNFPRIYKDEIINPRFKLMRNGAFTVDTFSDEILLAIDTLKGLVIILGCSHPGIKNMLDAVRRLLGKPVYAVLGGTHLIEASEESLELSLEYLTKSEIKVIGVSHCTGQKAMSVLSNSGGRYFHNSTGSSFVVG